MIKVTKKDYDCLFYAADVVTNEMSCAADEEKRHYVGIVKNLNSLLKRMERSLRKEKKNDQANKI